jgi:glycerol kinase
MADSPCVLAIDQSTSGTKALVFDGRGAVVSRADRAHEQKVSPQGWVSHDPREIYRNTIAAAGEALKRGEVAPSRVRGLGLSNQRETAMVWDRSTGSPLCDAVVWQCPRGQGICDALADQGEAIRRATGLRLSPYFSAAKIAWILEHTRNRGNRNLRAGTMDSWLIYKLTGNFSTDYSNASRTQLFNISDLAWDRGICELFGVAPEILPELRDSNACFGMTDLEGLLPRPVPLHAVMGDSHAALFGHGGVEKGMGKVTYGTGSSVMIHIGPQPVFCDHVVTSLAWGIDGRAAYVLEGNVNYSGAVIRWLTDDLGLLSSAKEAGELAARANPDDTAYLVPAFSGLGAPYWKPLARACFWGMGRTTGRAELVRAAEESIAYQIRDVTAAIREESGVAPVKLFADGGPAKDAFLMQFQSDILDMPLAVTGVEEISAAGAAWMAGTALGIYPPGSFAPGEIREYTPGMKPPDRERKLRGWREALTRVTG